MSLNRRSWLRALAAGSTVSTLVAQKLATVSPDAAATPQPRFFSERQLATLRRAADLLQPTLGPTPGALAAGAPEFLDFLLSVSPAPRQTLYRNGLDHLEATAQKRFRQPFAALSPEQADQLFQPLLVPWSFDPPKDPLPRFFTDLRADLRTATLNSAEFAKAAANSPRRRRGPGGGFYWLPIDPTRPL